MRDRLALIFIRWAMSLTTNGWAFDALVDAEAMQVKEVE